MDIRRIDGCSDGRFSPTALLQHGAYLISGEPYEVEITGPSAAVVRGPDAGAYRELIKAFRFHAPHIVRFFSEAGTMLESYPAPPLLEIGLAAIQPSQFFVDEDKLNAVRTFIHRPEDVVIQVVPWGDRFISLDGHTRLYLAAQSGFQTVRAVESETDDWIWTFVDEAGRRGVFQPADLTLLPHERYVIEWDRFCDGVFAGRNG